MRTSGNRARGKATDLLPKLALLVSMLALPCAAQAAQGRLEVDAGQVRGDFRPLQDTAGVPGAILQFRDFPDVTRHWKDSRVRMVRSYDWQSRLDTVDNPESLFPRWSADPDDPASYNFSATDAWVDRVRSIGGEVLFTFATSIPRNKLPAADLATYERVVEHIVRHYAKGWGGGAPSRIAQWEFSDQPDLGQLHFAGTPQQFYEMYGAVARAVKRVDPALKVGGPGLAFGLNPDSPFREAFLDTVRQRGWPLDFFSFIHFADGTHDPLDFNVVGAELRRLLDARGFAATRLYLVSWNQEGIPTSKSPPLERAAFQASAAMYLQDSAVDHAFLFRGDTGIDPHYGFVDPARIYASEGAADPQGVAFRFSGQTLRGKRLPVTGGDLSGFTSIASRDPDEPVVRVLVSHYAATGEFLEPRKSPDLVFRIPLGPSKVLMTFRQTPFRPGIRPQGIDTYRLVVRNLPWGSGGSVITRYRIDGSHAGEPIETLRAEGETVDLSAPLAAPAVEMVEIRPATNSTADGPGNAERRMAAARVALAGDDLEDLGPRRPAIPMNPAIFPRQSDGHPDFSGVWFAGIKDYVTLDDSHLDIPLTPEFAAVRQKRVALIEAGTPAPDYVSTCQAFGMPRVASYGNFELVHRPDGLWMLTEVLHEVRRIYLDAKEHGEFQDPSFGGLSVGHWEGDTLVVSTDKLKAGYINMTGAPHSDRMTIVERIRMVNPDAIENEITLTDPVALMRPWTVVQRYVRQKPGFDITEYNCLENYRSGNGGQGTAVPAQEPTDMLPPSAFSQP